ncbi:hypothetical protein ACFL02_00900 [Planctomycetota bacterium]
MLGIDIGDNSIRVVNLERQGSGFRLRGTLEVAFTPEQSSEPTQWGRLLGEALSQVDWRDQKAVMTIPSRFCFIRYFPAGMVASEAGEHNELLDKEQAEKLLDRVRQSMMAPTEQLVFDLWIGSTRPVPAAVEEPGSGYGVLVGAAQQTAVRFCRDLAAVAAVRVQSLELRSLAAINGLLLNWHEAAEENIAVVYLESDRADVAIINPEGIVSLPSVILSTDESDPNLDAWCDNLIQQLRRIFNTAKLADAGSTPERLFVAGYLPSGREYLEKLVRQLHQKLSFEVALCSPWRGIIHQKEDQQTDLSPYIPALGAAFDGLEASPTWFNFLLPRGARIKKKPYFTWKPFALTAVLAVIMLSVFWFYLVQQKNATLQDLNYQIGQAAPALETTRRAREKWNLFRSYVPAPQGGARLEYLRILGEISRLFPSTEVAYVSSLEIFDRATAGNDITITGFVFEGQVLTNFVNNLENSPMFQDVRRFGPDMVSKLNYPFSFTVTCNLRRAAMMEK